RGWPGNRLHREYFAGAARASAEDKPFGLRIASSGQLVHVAPDVSALDALAAAGIALPSSCLAGVCGTCITGVLEGEPEHRDQVLDATEKARNNCFAPCCSRARSDVLTLDL
ncbi:2Fe-2S iron-sulfur cluster-binding protein, partial [Massilia cavernae]